MVMQIPAFTDVKTGIFWLSSGFLTPFEQITLIRYNFGYDM